MVEPGHMNGGADAQIVPAGPATDVMDDENDKVSQDVVAAPLNCFMLFYLFIHRNIHRNTITTYRCMCLYNIYVCIYIDIDI